MASTASAESRTQAGTAEPARQRGSELNTDGEKKIDGSERPPLTPAAVLLRPTSAVCAAALVLLLASSSLQRAGRRPEPLGAHLQSHRERASGQGRRAGGRLLAEMLSAGHLFKCWFGPFLRVGRGPTHLAARGVEDQPAGLLYMGLKNSICPVSKFDVLYSVHISNLFKNTKTSW